MEITGTDEPKLPDLQDLHVDWGKPLDLRLRISIGRICGCTKVVEFDDEKKEYVVKYTRPIGSGECTGGGCCNHRGRTEFV